MATFTQRENGNWTAKVRRRGWPPQSSTQTTKALAEAWARKIERDMDVGTFINRDDAERTTFADAAARYSREVLEYKRGKIPDASRLRRVVEAFGKYSLASISSTMLSKFRDDLAKTLSPQSVKHHLGLVSRVFQVCALDWGIALPHGNPAKLVRKPKVDNGRTRLFETGEERLLIDALQTCKSTWTHAAFVLAIETAGRRSELLSLKWTEVDLVKRTARLRGVDGRITKNGDEYRDVPLSSLAVELLQSLPRTAKEKVVRINQKDELVSAAERVLPITHRALQQSFEHAVARARRNHLHTRLAIGLQAAGFNEDDIAAQHRALIYGKKKPAQTAVQLLANLNEQDKTLINFHFHDTRHIATTRLATKLQMHELMKVTGHKTSDMLARYYHPRAEDLALKLG